MPLFPYLRFLNHSNNSPSVTIKTPLQNLTQLNILQMFSYLGIIPAVVYSLIWIPLLRDGRARGLRRGRRDRPGDRLLARLRPVAEAGRALPGRPAGGPPGGLLLEPGPAVAAHRGALPRRPRAHADGWPAATCGATAAAADGGRARRGARVRPRRACLRVRTGARGPGAADARAAVAGPMRRRGLALLGAMLPQGRSAAAAARRGSSGRSSARGARPAMTARVEPEERP